MLGTMNSNNNKTKGKKSSNSNKVSFSSSVLERGTTSRVTVVEQHDTKPTVRDALGREVDVHHVQSSADDGESEATPNVLSAVTFSMEEHGTKSNSNNASTTQKATAATQYHSIKVNLGLLKCGYRYSTILPLHITDQIETSDKEESERMSTFKVNDIGECLDTDLEAEAIDKTDAIEENDPGQAFLELRLAARRPGPYTGSFAVVLLQQNKKMDGVKRHIISIEVRATMFGKDQGTPALKKNVTKIGKLAGYDSDEETEWQGFQDDTDDEVGSEADADSDAEWI